MQKDSKDTASTGESRTGDGKAVAASESNNSVGQMQPGTLGSLSFGGMPGLPKLGDSAGFAKFKESL